MIRSTLACLVLLATACGGGDPTDAGLDAARSDGAVLDGGALDGAVLDGGALDGAVLDGGALDGAVLDGAVLDGGALDGAVLDGAVLDGAVLDGAVLDGAVLDGGSRDAAVIDGGARDGGSLDGAVTDAGSTDAGPPPVTCTEVGLTTWTRSDSASVGTPDTYFFDVNPGDPFCASITGGGSGSWGVTVSNGTSLGVYCRDVPSCTIRVPAGQTTLLVTALTSDIGSYTLTVRYIPR